jgi:flagellar biosynthesis protein FlhG
MDQAHGLRQMASSSPVKVIAITGGKGGVGKTNVSVNLSIALSELGKKVILFDADVGLANVDVLLGIRCPYNLYHVLTGEKDLDEIIVEGPKGLRIIPASSGKQELVTMSPMEHAGLVRAFSSVSQQLDVLIVDTAAGISGDVINFSKAAQDILLVVCDEPTSITDAYALIKLLSTQNQLNRFKVLANMVRSPKEGRDLFAKLTKVTERFLDDVLLEYVGAVPFDENVRKSVRKQQAIVEAFPGSPAAQAIKLLAKNVASWPIPKRPGGNLEFFVERMLERDFADV